MNEPKTSPAPPPPAPQSKRRRKPKNDDRELHRVLRESWSMEDRAAAVRQLSQNAIKEGDTRAAALLLAYAYGRPRMRIDPAADRPDGTDMTSDLGFDCNNDQLLQKFDEVGDRLRKKCLPPEP